MSDNNQTMAELAAMLNNHQMTDEDGALKDDETPVETTAAQEENTVDEPASPEKGAETEAVEPNPTEEETDPELAVDDTGKRYVPQKRFDQVYGRQKSLERELAELKAQQTPAPAQNLPQPATPMNKADALENELLKATLPQFNPDSDRYDPGLDTLGFQIYQASRVYNPVTNVMEPTITQMEAGRRALAQAKQLTEKITKVQAEARQVKTLQADQGMTSRVSNRQPVNQEPGDDASLEEQEAYLKANGLWNKA